ncbi:MAG: ligand-binding sensor domain-containing protein [Calditrichia bacterium]
MLYWFVILLFLTVGNTAREIRLERISVGDGLSADYVMVVNQDSAGYLWVGTSNGLNRYDGYSIKTFHHQPDVPHSISSHYVTSLWPDGKYMWIGTANGLNRLNLHTLHFETFKHSPNNSESISSNYVRDLLIDSKGILWIATRQGLNRYNPDSKSFIRYQPNSADNNSIGSLRLHRLLEDSNGSLWISSLHGLSRLDLEDREKGRFQTYQNDPNDPFSLSDDYPGPLYEANGNLYIGVRSGLCRYNFADDRFYHLYPNKIKQKEGVDYSYRNIFPLNDRQLLLTNSQKFMSILDLDAPTQPEQISMDPAMEYLLRDVWSSNIFLDRSGTFWLGTSGKGLLKWLPTGRKFAKLELSGNKDDASDSITELHEDANSTVWVGTKSNAIYKLGQKTNLQERYNFTKGSNDFNFGDTRLLTTDKQGNLWAGGMSVLLKKPAKEDRFSTKLLFHHFMEAPIATPNVGQIKDLLEYGIIDKRGVLWLGTWKGFICYDTETESMLFYANTPNHARLGFGSRVHEMTFDADSSLWISTEQNPLVKLTLKDTLDNFRVPDEMDVVIPAYANQLGIYGIEVNTLLFDRKSTIWVCSENGLLHYDPIKKTQRIYTEKDGLAHRNITAILEDDDGTFWISSKRGISHIAPYSDRPFAETCRNFTPDEGLQGYNFNGNSALLSNDGRFFFGGENGINYFRPGNIRQNTVVPNISVTGIQIGDNLLTGTLGYSIEKPLIMPYSEKIIRFNFSALDFSRPAQNQYAYFLEGFEDSLNYSSTEHQAIYTNLDPGAYTFKVIGSNNDGIWNKVGTSIRLIIPPPFWLTWWFRGILLILTIAIPLFLYRSRIQRLLELEKLRVRIASDLHDDIGSTLNSISMKAELMKEGVAPEENPKNLSSIAIMCQEMISRMSDVVWSIDARNDRIQNMLERMQDAADTLLTNNDIHVHFSQEGLQLDKRIPVDIRQNIYLIYKEAINNIAKYSDANAATIRFVNSGGRFRMTIHDDGKGLEDSQKRSGHGLRNMHMRAKAIDADLTIASDNGAIIILERESV